MKNAVCLFCLFLLHTATAQVYKHRSFATADGLSSTTIYHALQDRKGYLWFGTDAGVTRFDGTHFKQYYKDNGLSDNDVIHLFGGKTNRVFFATYNGRLSFFDNDKFANPSNTAFLRQAAFNYALVAGFEDVADNIWLGTKDGSIYRLNKNGVQPFGKKSSKKGDAAHFFQQDSQGQIWIDGNYKIDKDTIAHTRLRYTFVGSNAFYVSPQGNESIFLTDEGLITMRDTVQSLLIPIKNIAQPFLKEYGYLMRDAQQNKTWPCRQ